MQKKNDPKNFWNKEIIFFKSVSIIEKYNFYEYLSVMVDAGVTVSNALETMQLRIKNPYLKEKIQELNTYVSSWDSFSKSMKKIPQIFDVNEVSIIESWETTWMLVESFLKLSEDLKKIHDLKSKIKSALTYPIIIFIFLISAVIVVLTYVIPSLDTLFKETQVELPWATVALIATSNFLINHWAYIIFFIATIFVGFIWYYSTRDWKKSITNFFLWMPLIWPIYKNYIIANISSTLGSLIWSWVNIIKTLKLTGKASWSSIYEALFEDIIEKVSEGSKIVTAMEEVDEEWKYFPVDFIQMLSVWERTAKLEQINKKIHIQYLREIDYSLANLTKWIEPIAIFLSGGFVLWFAFAIFGAILKITQTVS